MTWKELEEQLGKLDMTGPEGKMFALLIKHVIGHESRILSLERQLTQKDEPEEEAEMPAWYRSNRVTVERDDGEKEN